MRDYDKYTPAERAKRDLLREELKASRILVDRPLSRQCSVCKGTNFYGDNMEWILDRFAGSDVYLRKCLDCGNVQGATGEELAAARAQEQTGIVEPVSSTRKSERMPQDSVNKQEESVDETVTDAGVSRWRYWHFPRGDWR